MERNPEKTFRLKISHSTTFSDRQIRLKTFISASVTLRDTGAPNEEGTQRNKSDKDRQNLLELSLPFALSNRKLQSPSTNTQ